MALIERLLARTSRSFAVAIPLLPQPTRQEVAVAYLLLRIADTFEDATGWPREDRLAALGAFASLLKTRSAEDAARLGAEWARVVPCEEEGHRELLAETAAVVAELEGFEPRRRAMIVHHVLRTTEGMADFVAGARADGSIALSSEADLRRYCYVVAGIVGELLTDLFVDAAPSLKSAEPELRARAAAFGEGLQLVNILKDERDDADGGRVWLSATVGRERAIALAREDLKAAGEYVAALQSARAPRGIVAFCAFPVLLARATLEATEKLGAGAKVGRGLVGRMLERMNAALDRGGSAVAD